MYKERLTLYDKLIDTCPNIERKGKSMPYTSANGYMFSQLNKAGEIGIRLSKETGKEFMEKYNATEFKSYGAVMREYVKVPDNLLNNLDLLSEYLNKGHEYVLSLPPK